MMPSLVRPLRLFAASLLLGGCALANPQTAPSPEAIAAEWSVVLAQAGAEVASNRYSGAERLLVDFQQRYPTAPATQTATFYRALFRLDPANPAASPRDAVVLLDTYLASPTDSARRADALALRRVAVALDAKPAVVTVAAPKEKESPAARTDTGAKDEEIARLREELSKANAELERIRRRVSTPKP
jgi:hypothetical protein